MDDQLTALVVEVHACDARNRLYILTYIDYQKGAPNFFGNPQVAKNKRPLYPKVAQKIHRLPKVASNMDPKIVVALVILTTKKGPRIFLETPT